MAFKMRGNPMQRNFGVDKATKKLDKAIEKLDQADAAYGEGKYGKSKRKAKKAVKKVEKAVAASNDDLKYFEESIKETAGKIKSGKY